MLASIITAEDFGRLFLKFKDKYIAIACSYIRDRAAAEDVVTETFTVFWNNRHDIELKSSPEAYILQAVKNRCLNYRRDQTNRMRLVESVAEDTVKALELETSILAEEDLGFLFKDEVVRIFREFMLTMPELTRKIFIDSRFEGLTYTEIADKYEITPRKVKREIQKVLGRMRENLKDYLPALLLLFPNLL